MSVLGVGVGGVFWLFSSFFLGLRFLSRGRSFDRPFAKKHLSRPRTAKRSVVCTCHDAGDTFTMAFSLFRSSFGGVHQRFIAGGVRSLGYPTPPHPSQLWIHMEVVCHDSSPLHSTPLSAPPSPFTLLCRHPSIHPFIQPKLLVGYDLVGGGDRGGPADRTGMPSPGSLGLLPPQDGSAAGAGDDNRTSLGLLSYDTRTDAEPLVLDEIGCREGCSAFGQSTQART